MRKIYMFLLLTTLTGGLFAQQSIEAADASKFVGQSVKVCGKIYGGKFLDRSPKQLTLLNMGAQYPNQLLTIVIEGEKRKAFTYKPEEKLMQKEVCVVGVIKEFKGKYEIIIEKEADISIKE